MKEQFLDAMNFRHACKEFDPTKKITDEDFNYILNVGRLSPSSFGFEPWKFLVIQSDEKRKKIKEACWGAQGQLPTCSHFVFILAKKSYFMRHDRDYIFHIMKDIKKLPDDIIKMRKNFYEKFQEIDFKLTVSERAMTDWACKQTYIALANMMSAAAFIGIDSCPMEGFNPEEISKILENHFQVDPSKYFPSVMVAFGYRKNEVSFEKTRQDLEDIVEFF